MTTHPPASMTSSVDDDDDTCENCGQDRYSLCDCNDGPDSDAPDSWDGARLGPPDSHRDLLEAAIYSAEQARDVTALRHLIAQRDGLPLHKVWIHLAPLRTRKHRLRHGRKTAARVRRALTRGRRAAHRAGLDVRAVEIAFGWTHRADITAICIDPRSPPGVVVWTDGGERSDQVLTSGDDTDDDLPW